MWIIGALPFLCFSILFFAIRKTYFSYLKKKSFCKLFSNSFKQLVAVKKNQMCWTVICFVVKYKMCSDMFNFLLEVTKSKQKLSFRSKIAFPQEWVSDLVCPFERRWLQSSLPDMLMGQEAEGHVQQPEQALKYLQQKKWRDATNIHAEGPGAGLLRLKPAGRPGVRKGHRRGQKLSGKGVPRSGAEGGEASKGRGRAGCGVCFGLISNRAPSDSVYTILSFMRCFNFFN